MSKEISSSGGGNKSLVRLEIGYSWKKDKFTLTLKDLVTSEYLRVFMSADDFIEFGNDMVHQGIEYKKNPEKYMMESMT